jgi:hypothetical protein
MFRPNSYQQAMRQQNPSGLSKEKSREDHREIRLILDEIENEGIPQRLLDLAEQLRATLIAHPKWSFNR